MKAEQKMEGEVLKDARELVENELLWDMTIPWGDWGRPEMKDQAIDEMIAAGYTVASLTLAGDDYDHAAAISAISAERLRIREDERLVLIETVEDVDHCHREGKLGLSFHFQGSVPVGRDIGLVEVYYSLGVRHILMAYNQKNFVGDGCHERTDSGLSRFGVSLVREMERVGMLVDVSHTGFRTSMDVFETACRPVIFSHSNPKAIHDHPRNITDEQIRACARSGGVIGVNGVGVFLGDADASSETIFACIDHIASLVGPGHVGLGLDSIYDFEGVQRLAMRRGRDAYPEKFGYESRARFVAPAQVVEIADLMLRNGYSREDILGVLGLNWKRVCAAVWRSPGGAIRERAGPR